MWTYFEKKETGNVKKVICTVENCKKPEMAYSTTTMRNHLERVHKIEFKKVVSTSMQSVLSPVIFDQKQVDFELAMALGTSTAALQILEYLTSKMHFKN